jgi:hypothetical protein
VSPRCGSCGWEFSHRTLLKHADTACGEGDSKAPSVKYTPEIDDVIRSIEERIGEDIQQ